MVIPEYIGGYGVQTIEFRRKNSALLGLEEHLVRPLHAKGTDAAEFVASLFR